jgi:transcriptional regulator with XRE-family HTH domain
MLRLRARVQFNYLQGLGAIVDSPLPPDSLSDLYMEACVAAIRGFCRLEGITQAYLAECIGITPVHLSYVLRGHRLPGTKFERGIARSTRLPAALRENLLDNLWAARRHAAQEAGERRYRAANRPLAELAAALEAEYTVLGFGQIEAERARRVYQRLYRECAALTSRLAYAGEDAQAYVRLCVVQAETGCVLDRVYESLTLALLVERVASTLTGPDTRSQVRELYAPQTNACRVKGLAYYHLHLYEEAYEECLRMEQTQAVRDRPDIWWPHVARDKLKAVSHRSRFSIREAEACAGRAWDACASQVWEGDVAQMLALLVDLSLARCYVSYGGRSSLLKARRMMAAYRGRVERGCAGAITPLHEVLFYRTLVEVEDAAAAAGLGRLDGAAEGALRSALRIASQAGLANQLAKLRLRYPAAGADPAEREGINPG